MSLKQSLTLAAVVAAFLLGIFIFRSCGSGKPTGSTINLDSLLAAAAKQSAELKKYQDSTEKILDEQDRIILALKVEKDQAQEEARKSKEKALYWAKLYKDAKANRDTAGQLYACDSLEAEFQSYIVRVDAYIVKSDSTIQVQHETIQLQQQVIERQKSHIGSMEKNISLMADTNSQLVRSNNQLQADLRKARKWGNIKMGLGAGLGAVIGNALK